MLEPRGGEAELGQGLANGRLVVADKPAERLPVCPRNLLDRFDAHRRPASRFSGSARITRPRAEALPYCRMNQATPRDLDGGELSFADEFVYAYFTDTIGGAASLTRSARRSIGATVVFRVVI